MYSVLFLVPPTNALLPRLAIAPFINGEGKLEYVGSDRTEKRGQRLDRATTLIDIMTRLAGGEGLGNMFCSVIEPQKVFPYPRL